METGTERELFARLRRGEAEAFDALYEHYRPRLFGFLARLTGRRDLAEDLLQETWLRLARSAPSLPADCRVGAWLFTVARNLFYTERRRALLAQTRLRAHGPWAAPADPIPSPFDLAAASEIERQLEGALLKVPVEQREVLLLLAVERLSPSEAADVLGIKPEALRQRLHRARLALAAALEVPPLVGREA